MCLQIRNVNCLICMQCACTEDDCSRLCIIPELFYTLVVWYFAGYYYASKEVSCSPVFTLYTTIYNEHRWMFWPIEAFICELYPSHHNVWNISKMTLTVLSTPKCIEDCENCWGRSCHLLLSIVICKFCKLLSLLWNCIYMTMTLPSSMSQESSNTRNWRWTPPWSRRQ